MVSPSGGPGTTYGCTAPPANGWRPRIVGEIELTGDALELPGDGLTMIAYSAEPGSQAEDQLQLLAAWSATAHSSETNTTGPRAIDRKGHDPWSTDDSDPRG